MIVEKQVINLLASPQTKTDFYAAAFPERNKNTVEYSLCFEAHLTPWTTNRAEAEAMEVLK